MTSNFLVVQYRCDKRLKQKYLLFVFIIRRQARANKYIYCDVQEKETGISSLLSGNGRRLIESEVGILLIDRCDTILFLWMSPSECECTVIHCGVGRRMTSL
jgi:hypothetical protein